MTQTNRNTSGLVAPWRPGHGGCAKRDNRAFQKLLAQARRTSAEALETVIDCMRDKEAPWPARIAAANVVLERAWGKAPERLAIDGQGIGTLRIEFVDPRRPEPEPADSGPRVIEADAFQFADPPSSEQGRLPPD